MVPFQNRFQKGKSALRFLTFENYSAVAACLNIDSARVMPGQGDGLALFPTSEIGLGFGKRPRRRFLRSRLGRQIEIGISGLLKLSF